MELIGVVTAKHIGGGLTRVPPTWGGVAPTPAKRCVLVQPAAVQDWLPLAGVVIAQFVLVGLYFVKQACLRTSLVCMYSAA